MNDVTAVEIVRELKRLAAVYNPPKGESDQVAGVWAEVLAGMSGDEFRAAVSEYMRGTGRYFPRPADLRELVREARSKRGVSSQSSTPAKRSQAELYLSEDTPPQPTRASLHVLSLTSRRDRCGRCLASSQGYYCASRCRRDPPAYSASGCRPCKQGPEP